jgi:hypothetical protein
MSIQWQYSQGICGCYYVFTHIGRGCKGKVVKLMRFYSFFYNTPVTFIFFFLCWLDQPQLARTRSLREIVAKQAGYSDDIPVG